MRKKGLMIAAIALLAAAMILPGCTQKKKSEEQTSQTPPPEMPKAPMFQGTVGGITWSFPNTWTVAPEKPMRSATYIISPIEDDTDSIECAIYYFGADSGGGTEENIDRWAGQFEQPGGGSSKDAATINEESINGLKVTTIDLEGTYNVAGGPMMQVTDTKPGYRLLGAIVEGPQGSIFFKMTGPEKTMEATAADFDTMIKSVRQVTS